MADEKRLFWLQLKNTYFNQLTQKKMRKQQNGLEMQVIYLRMMLLSLDNKGYIFYQGVYDSIEEELSEEFNEPIELVKQTINFLVENKMVKTDRDEGGLFIPEALECTVSKGASAIRMERKRAKDKASQCDDNVTDSDDDVTTSDTYKDKNKVREEKESDNTLFNSLTIKEGDTLPPSADAGGASTFTLMECQSCAADGKINITEEGIEAFYDRMEKDGWMIKGNPVTNLLMAMRGFAKNHKRYQKQAQKNKVYKSFKSWLHQHGYDSNYDKNGDFEDEISVGEEIIQSIFDVIDPNESMQNIYERLIDGGFSKEDIKPIMMLFHKWVSEKNKE